MGRPLCYQAAQEIIFAQTAPQARPKVVRQTR